MEKNEYPGRFLHEAIIASSNMYPCDIQAEKILESVLKCTKHFIGVKDISSNSTAIQELFTNLFWLFFCAKFQPEIFAIISV